jgi:PhnB protein
MVKPVPDGYHTVTPYLIAKNATDALEWYKKAFGATEKMRLAGPGGSLMHGEITIGDSVVMLADEMPDMGIKSPESLGGAGVSIMLYVEDVDTAFARAIAAGGKELRPLADQFYGDRTGTLMDPYGHTWTIGTHTEDLSEEEVETRFQEMMQQQGGG